MSSLPFILEPTELAALLAQHAERCGSVRSLGAGGGTAAPRGELPGVVKSSW